jgi:hypothetical protein
MAARPKVLIYVNCFPGWRASYSGARRTTAGAVVVRQCIGLSLLVLENNVTTQLRQRFVRGVLSLKYQAVA